MQKLSFPGMRSLDPLRSFSGSVQGSSRNHPVASRSSDSISYGSFTTLKLTAEKLVKEQASVKADLDMAQGKLAKASEQICTLEAKLQDINNENAMLKVKQVEDAKLWKGLDSKLSSTKTLCDQLTETLQHLACRVQEAEEDKKVTENKLSTSSKAFDELHVQINALVEKMNFAETTINIGKEKLNVFRQEKEELEKRFEDEHQASKNLIADKDSRIQRLEAIIEEEKMFFKNLNSQFVEVNHALSLKDEICTGLSTRQQKLEMEKTTLQSSNEELLQKLCTSNNELTALRYSLQSVTSEIAEFEKTYVQVLDKVNQLSIAFDSFSKLAQEHNELTQKCAQRKFDILHDQFLHLKSENSIFQSEIKEQRIKVIEEQKAQEFLMVQHAEECRLAEEKVRGLENERQSLMSNKLELETKVTKSEEEIKNLSEISSLTHHQMENLLQKLSKLEHENEDLRDKLKTALREKEEEIETLHKDIETRDQHVESLKGRASELHVIANEKEQMLVELKEKEMQLEHQKAETEVSLGRAEIALAEARKQYDLMLEGKQLELTKHLSELSLKNDQAINDIRKKYEIEKQEIVNSEKEKADNRAQEVEKYCAERIARNEEDARQKLQLVHEECDALINHTNQNHEKQVASLKTRHGEELQHIQLQAENALREQTTLLKKVHEEQMKVLKYQHEDECRKLHEELELQKSKEEKQRALLHLQCKVMDEDHHKDLEVDSKKEYSVTSMKQRDFNDGKFEQLVMERQETQSQEGTYQRVVRTPMTNLLMKGDKGSMGSIISFPKHGRKVTHYEVETSDGKTIKRRKTKRTVMFGDPSVHKTLRQRTPKFGSDCVKLPKVTNRTPRNSNIGDLFSEGSLNPYADDPYAFD